MFSSEDRDRWADDHGFSRGRCPACHRSIWIESGCLVECDTCGWSQEVRCIGCEEEFPHADMCQADNGGYLCESCVEAINNAGEVE